MEDKHKMSVGVVGLRKIIETIAADPVKALPQFKEAYHGITDDEAIALINLFTGLYIQPVSTQKEWNKKQKAYSAALKAARKKYPIGQFPTFDIATLDLPLIDIEL